jgi:hypothetical protein
MLTPDGFEELLQALTERGYSREIAEDYASRIGDTPEEPAGPLVDP